MNKRLGIYTIYDKEGVVDRYVLYFLGQIRPLLEKLIVVCNGKLCEESRRLLIQYADEVIVRENKGFDAMAVRYVLIDICGWDYINKFESVVIMNDTFYGPFYPLDEMFDEMDSRNADLWGLLLRIKGETSNTNITMFGAFFYVMSNKLLNKKSWRKFWKTLDGDNWLFSQAITEYEYKLIPECEKAGCVWDAYLRTDNSKEIRKESTFDDYGNIAYELIRYYHYPFLKRKPLAESIHFEETDGSSQMRALEYVNNYLDYDVDMIWENLLRKYPIGELNQSLKMNSIIGIHQSEDGQPFARPSIVLRTTQENWISEYIEYIAGIEYIADVYVFTSNKACYESLSAHSNNIELIFLYEGDNYLAKLSEICKTGSLLLYMDDSCLTYDGQVIAAGRTVQNIIHECMWKDKESVQVIYDGFQKDKRLGVGILPLMCHDRYICGFKHEWGKYHKKCNKILENIKCEFEEKCINEFPIFWIKSEIMDVAVAKLQVECIGDVEQADIIGRIVPYIAQKMGYYTKKIYTKQIAEVMLSDYDNIIGKFLEMGEKYGDSINEYSDFRYVGLIPFCKKYREIYIYGAGILGKRVLAKLMESSTDNIGGFIVSEGHRTCNEIEGYTVSEITEVNACDDIGVIVAIAENKQDILKVILQKAGFKNMYCV